MQERTSSDAVGNSNISDDVNNPGLLCPRVPVEQLVQLAVQLPPLPGVYGHDDPRFLARRLEGLAEGPHKGGAAHLRDEAHIQVIRAVNNEDNDGRAQAVGG